MKAFLAGYKNLLHTTFYTATVGTVITLSSISPVAAANFKIEGIFNDNQPFSGIFSTEKQTLTDYRINVGSAKIPTQSKQQTLNAFTYSPTICNTIPFAAICNSNGAITPTSLHLHFFAALGGDSDSRNFAFNVPTAFPTDGNTISGNAFESFQCTRCGGNIPSSFKRVGIGTVTALSVATVPEPKINWVVLTAGFLGAATMYKMRSLFTVKL